MRAEVGLLTRNIKIEGAYYEDLFEQSYGARVLVGKMHVGKWHHNRIRYKGKICLCFVVYVCIFCSYICDPSRRNGHVGGMTPIELLIPV